VKSKYNVGWATEASIELIKMGKSIIKKHRIDYKYVFKRSKWVLSNDPESKGEYIDDPRSEFHGYYWVKLEGVVMLYLVDNKTLEVQVDACFHARSNYVAEEMYDIHPDFD
jgi:hypothetical protein